jgi:hypothetical protein
VIGRFAYANPVGGDEAVVVGHPALQAAQRQGNGEIGPARTNRYLFSALAVGGIDAPFEAVGRR